MSLGTADVDRELARFDPAVPIEEAETPPASWYREPAVLVRERERTFRRRWVYACRADEVAEPGARLAVDVAGDGYLVVRGADGVLRGFHDVCRHHGARLVEPGAPAARGDAIVCPYHGWTYRLDGRLARAPRIGGMRSFDRERCGLAPVVVEAWGPFVFVHAGEPERPLADELAPLAAALDVRALEGLRWVRRRAWTIGCNWKVFVDNYLDGGYHIAHLHRGLASQLSLDGYRTEVFGTCNVQTCAAGPAPGRDVGLDLADRIGAGAAYAWVHPTFMLNVYGPLADTNLVRPLGPERCEVVFEHAFPPGWAPERIEASLAASDATQEEDVAISESVQRGLASPAYDRGRYAPRVETAMHHFHRLLAADLAG